MHPRRHLERRFLGLMAIGNQPADHIDQKVGGATMARVFALRDVFNWSVMVSMITCLRKSSLSMSRTSFCVMVPLIG